MIQLMVIVTEDYQFQPMLSSSNPMKSRGRPVSMNWNLGVPKQAAAQEEERNRWASLLFPKV